MPRQNFTRLTERQKWWITLIGTLVTTALVFGPLYYKALAGRDTWIPRGGYWSGLFGD